MRPGFETLRQRCNPLVCVLALTAALGLANRAGAQPSSSDEMARRHFESGVAYLQESDYESALKAFTKAYDLSKRPAILLNIATVHERRGDIPAALAALRQYLELEPSGEHAETAKLRIGNLEKRLAEQEQAPPPPPEPAPAPVAPAGDPQPSAAPEPARAPLPPEPARPTPWPAYIALGLGGVAAGGALVTGILASDEYSDLDASCAPNCSDDEVSAAKTMAWVSTGLTVAAGVGVGVGVLLLLVDSPSASEPPVASFTPRMTMGFDARGADARATWRF